MARRAAQHSTSACGGVRGANWRDTHVSKAERGDGQSVRVLHVPEISEPSNGAWRVAPPDTVLRDAPQLFPQRSEEHPKLRLCSSCACTCVAEAPTP